MAGVVSVSTALLDGYVGESIEDICPLGFGTVGDADNHCAHFVSHVLKINDGLHVGYTCAQTSFDRKTKNKGKGAGACLRVNEVFNFCDDLADPAEDGCLAYITTPSNVDKNGLMGSQSKKHIGIYFQGKVWHYGNTNDAVKCQTLAEFKKHYTGKTVTLFTAFPDGAKALTLEEVQALV